MRGAEELGMPLDKVIVEVIAALKSDAERLGLPGSASRFVGAVIAVLRGPKTSHSILTSSNRIPHPV
jgi:hypothetical protein